jgi:hypothetical protein
VHECVIINTSNIELNVTQKHQQKNPKDFDVPRVKKNAYEKGLCPKQFKYNLNKINSTLVSVRACIVFHTYKKNKEI